MTETVKSQANSLTDKLDKLARAIASPGFSAAGRAALKRYIAGQSVPLEFYKLWLTKVERDLPSEQDTPVWALLAWGLAIYGAGATSRDCSLGRVLAESRYSEARLERLLAADENIRTTLFASTIRFLSRDKSAFDWLDAARLLFARKSEARERIRRKIAADYYHHNLKTQ